MCNISSQYYPCNITMLHYLSSVCAIFLIFFLPCAILPLTILIITVLLHFNYCQIVFVDRIPYLAYIFVYFYTIFILYFYRYFYRTYCTFVNLLFNFYYSVYFSIVLLYCSILSYLNIKCSIVSIGGGNRWGSVGVPGLV